MPICPLKGKKGPKVVISKTRTFVPYYIMNKHKRMRTMVLAFCHVFIVIRALRIGKEKRFDVVVSQHHSSHLASFSAYVLSRIFKIPLIIKTHDVYDIASGMIEKLYLHVLDNVYHVILKRADHVFVVSESLRSKVIETHGLEKGGVSVFPNGVDVKTFRPDVDCGSLRRDLGVEDKKVILFIGGITEDRGLSLLVKALPKVVAEHRNIVVLIIGDGPQKSELEKLVRELNVEGFVKFIEPVRHRDIPMYISMADVTVGPLVARLDTFGSVPRKVVEYMACAKPVVVCRGGVSGDLIQDGYNGFLTSPGDPEKLAVLILSLINSPDSVRRVGLNARKRVEQFYDWAEIMNEFEKVLHGFNKKSEGSFCGFE